MGLSLGCPVAGPGVNRAAGQCPEGESPTEEVAGGVNPELGGSYVKRAPPERGHGDEGAGDPGR